MTRRGGGRRSRCRDGASDPTDQFGGYGPVLQPVERHEEGGDAVDLDARVWAVDPPPAAGLFGDRAGVRDIRYHDLRHTFGTRIAAQGVPMRALQEMMGHRDFKTTLIYADYAPSEMEAEWAEAAFGGPQVGPQTERNPAQPSDTESAY
jgi:hypothetical protein